MLCFKLRPQVTKIMRDQSEDKFVGNTSGYLRLVFSSVLHISFVPGSPSPTSPDHTSPQHSPVHNVSQSTLLLRDWGTHRAGDQTTDPLFITPLHTHIIIHYNNYCVCKLMYTVGFLLWLTFTSQRWKHQEINTNNCSRTHTVQYFPDKLQ